MNSSLEPEARVHKIHIGMPFNSERLPDRVSFGRKGGHINRYLALLCISILVACTEPEAAASELIKEPAECADDNCGIEVRLVKSLVPPADTLSPKLGAYLATNSRGEYFQTPTWTEHTFSVYDSNGVFIRAIGRRGEGPGEFGRLRAIFTGAGDTLLVVSSMPPNLDVFSPSLDFVRRSSLLPIISLVSTPGGEILVTHDNDHVTKDETVHRLDTKRLEYRKFSKEEPDAGLIKQHRVLAIAPDGTVWSIDSWKHVLYKFSAEGDLIGTYERNSSWFIVPETPDETNIRWRVRAAHIDASNILWTVIHNRSAGPDDSIRGLEEHSPTYLEAIDLASMSVIGRLSIDGSRLEGFLPDGRVYGLSDDVAGYPRTDIWVARIQKPEP